MCRMTYPDILISADNLVIEVKSKYTYNKDYKTNIEKANSVINLGFKFQFWVVDGDSIEIFEHNIPK